LSGQNSGLQATRNNDEKAGKMSHFVRNLGLNVWPEYRFTKSKSTIVRVLWKQHLTLP
jgi:hypothetical protein